MKIQHLLIAMALPAILALTGCETAQPITQDNAEPVAVATASMVKSEEAVVAPAAEAHPEHCAKHDAGAGHDCIEHCAKHKGKKDKACQKHCKTTVSPHHDCAKHCAEHLGVKDQACAHHGSATTKNCDTSHCSHHKGAAAHECGTEHCEKHGGAMSECCGSGHKRDK